MRLLRALGAAMAAAPAVSLTPTASVASLVTDFDAQLEAAGARAQHAQNLTRGERRVERLYVAVPRASSSQAMGSRAVNGTDPMPSLLGEQYYYSTTINGANWVLPFFLLGLVTMLFFYWGCTAVSKTPCLDKEALPDDDDSSPKLPVHRSPSRDSMASPAGSRGSAPGSG